MTTDDGAVGCICGCTCGGGCGTCCGCGKFVRFLMDAELKKLTLKPCLRRRMMRTKCKIPTTTKTTAEATPAVSPWFNSGGPDSVGLSENCIRIVALHMALFVPDARLHFPLRPSRCSLDAVQIVPQFATFAATHVAPVHDGEDDTQVMSHFVSEYPIESPYSYTPHYRKAKKTNKKSVSVSFKSNARGVHSFKTRDVPPSDRYSTTEPSLRNLSLSLRGPRSTPTSHPGTLARRNRSHPCNTDSSRGHPTRHTTREESSPPRSRRRARDA